MPIKVIPLGAGQDVGRSCVIVELGGKRVMFDCGMHMVSDQKYPDFAYLKSVVGKKGSKGEGNDLTSLLDCVLITHFHLDHCGSLPYFSEIVGYNGPIVATNPTKSIIPLMLEDFRKITNFQIQQNPQKQEL